MLTKHWFCRCFLEIYEFKKTLTQRSWSNRGQGSCAIKQIVAVGWYFFCKCADSTSHYLAKQLWGLEKPIWPSSKFDSENDDEMKSKEENMVFQIWSQVYLIHGFFVFEKKIIKFLTNFTPFFSGKPSKVFPRKKFLEKLWYGLRPMLRFYLYAYVCGRHLLHISIIWFWKHGFVYHPENF